MAIENSRHRGPKREQTYHPSILLYREANFAGLDTCTDCLTTELQNSSSMANSQQARKLQAVRKMDTRMSSNPLYGYEHQLGKLEILCQRSTKLALQDQSWCQHLRISKNTRCSGETSQQESQISQHLNHNRGRLQVPPLWSLLPCLDWTHQPSPYTPKPINNVEGSFGNHLYDGRTTTTWLCKGYV